MKSFDKNPFKHQTREEWEGMKAQMLSNLREAGRKAREKEAQSAKKST